MQFSCGLKNKSKLALFLSTFIKLFLIVNVYGIKGNLFLNFCPYALR